RKLLRPLTPIEINIDPCPLGGAGAATASASFAPLIGPSTFRMGDKEAYWHVGGGGLSDSAGGGATASASFAHHNGPSTLRMGDKEAYWHVGDGGLYENSGVESLLFLHLK